MLPCNNPDRIRIVFDDLRLVAKAGLLLPATIAQHLGLRELVDQHLNLGGAPERANMRDKMLTLVASAHAAHLYLCFGGINLPPKVRSAADRCLLGLIRP